MRRMLAVTVLGLVGVAAPVWAEKIELPMFVCHGAEDPITSPDATRSFFERVRSSDKTLIRETETNEFSGRHRDGSGEGTQALH